MAAKKKETKSEVSEIVKNVVAELKPALNEKMESLRADINADVEEKLKRIQIPQPQVAPPGGGMDLQGLVKSLSGSNGIDMSAISKMMGSMPMQAPPGVDMSKLTPEQHFEMMKSNQQNQLMMVILPELLKSNQGASPLMGEMMQRFFMENMLDGMNQRKAFTTFAMKLAGDPKLMEAYQNQQNNIVKPITDAISISKQAVPGAESNATQ